MYKKYLHTILDKYNEDLKKYDVLVQKKDDREYTNSEREEAAKKLIPKVEKELQKLSSKHFLVIQSDEDYDKPKNRFIAYNGFLIEFLHAGYMSRIVCYVIDVLTNKSVDVSVNCKIVAELDENVSLKDALQKLYED